MSPLILLVDADPDTREILGRAFRSRGHEVVAAADGETGLALADERSPDVVVGDFPLDVPGHSPFTRAVREVVRPPLVVSYTARVLAEEEAEAPRLVDEVLLKPSNPFDVVERVERLLARR